MSSKREKQHAGALCAKKQMDQGPWRACHILLSAVNPLINAMKILSPSSLPELPRKAMDLIKAGIYSLFELKESRSRYLLITDDGKRYLLNSNGSVLLEGHKIEDLQEAIAHAVKIKDVQGQYALINNC